MNNEEIIKNEKKVFNWNEYKLMIDNLNKKMLDKKY